MLNNNYLVHAVLILPHTITTYGFNKLQRKNSEGRGMYFVLLGIPDNIFPHTAISPISFL